MRRAASLVRHAANALLMESRAQCGAFRGGWADGLQAETRWLATGAAPAHRRGPVSYLSLGLTMMTGAGLLYYHQQTKQQKIQDAVHSQDQSLGQPALGGPFKLVDQDGKTFTDRDLLGEFALLYFGFTHCPDICPDELEKMAEAVDLVEKECGARIQPVFISIDPERDSVQQMKSYISEFHQRLVGLTGSAADVKATAKTYRVYYSKTHDSGNDYLVDHSIIMYLLTPDGAFSTFYGQNFTAERMAKSIACAARDWAQHHPDYKGLKESPHK